MAIALVQANSKYSGSASSDSLAFASNNTAGNLIIVAVGYNSASITVSSVADSKNNSYNSLTLYTYSGAYSSVRVQIWYAMNVGAGANTVTVTLSGSCDMGFSILEYSGLATTGAFDVETGISFVSTSTPATNNLTTTQANELLFCIGCEETVGVTWTAGTNYTRETQQTGQSHATEDRIVSSTGDYNASWSISSSSTGGALAMATFKAAGAGTYTLTADSGSYTKTGTVASLLKSSLLNAEANSYTKTGTDASLLYHRLISAEAGNYALTGQDINFLRAYVIAIESGNYELAGQIANLLKSHILSVDAGTYSKTGQDASLLKSSLISADVGSYDIIGAIVDLLKSFLISAEVGEYIVIGQDCTLTKTTVGYTLTCDAGTFDITGQDVALLKSSLVSAQVGTFDITGQDTSLLKSSLISADAGIYSISGQIANLLKSHILEANSNFYILTGQDINLLVDRRVVADSGIYVVTGQAVDLLKAFNTFYLPSTGATIKTPIYNAGWEDTSIVSRLKAVLTKISSAMTQVDFADADATNKDILFRQYILEDFPLAAQTIVAQSIKFQMRCKEPPKNNMFLTFAIYVFNSACNILRGTILAITRDDIEAAAGFLTNRQFIASSTQVITQARDILVIEIGMGGDPIPGKTHSSSISIGDNSGTDLPENNTEISAYNPWIRFEFPIAFVSPQTITITNGIASVEAFGTAIVNPNRLYPVSISSTETFGTTQINLKFYPISIDSLEIFGTPILGYLTIYPIRIPSAEMFGTPQVNLKIYSISIASSESIGTLDVINNYVLIPIKPVTAATSAFQKIKQEIGSTITENTIWDLDTTHWDSEMTIWDGSSSSDIMKKIKSGTTTMTKGKASSSIFVKSKSGSSSFTKQKES